MDKDEQKPLDISKAKGMLPDDTITELIATRILMGKEALDELISAFSDVPQADSDKLITMLSSCENALQDTCEKLRRAAENGTITEADAQSQLENNRLEAFSRKMEELEYRLIIFAAAFAMRERNGGQFPPAVEDVLEAMKGGNTLDELKRFFAITIEEQRKIENATPRTTIIQEDKAEYPIDKVNNMVWLLVAEADKNGQLKLLEKEEEEEKKESRPIKIGKNGEIDLEIDTNKKLKNSIVFYSLDFDGLPEGVTITKILTPFDKRVYIATANLFRYGNEIISTTQIYKNMGNQGNPQKKDLQKINESLTKMLAAHIVIDNACEVEATNGGYDVFRYDGSLLPFERVTAYINGKMTESAIHIFREPPLMTFSVERKQVTKVTKQLLESPISKTDANLRIDDYLIERIAQIKNGRAVPKMLYETIFANCNIKTAKQKQRAPQKIKEFLDHYKRCRWIAGYTQENDGITIKP